MPGLRDEDKVDPIEAQLEAQMHEREVPSHAGKFSPRAANPT